MTHHPKPARCKGCARRQDRSHCKTLPFHTMPVHRQDGVDVVVICTEFQTANGEVGKPFFHDHHRRRGK